MPMSLNILGQVAQIKLSPAKALWPIFETVINSIQSLEDGDIAEKRIVITAFRPEPTALMLDEKCGITDELTHFESFVVTDNGNGFNSENYSSFLEAYSQLKVKKGCKGIGRFLWLKTFDSVNISSVYCENNKWYKREFDFSAEKGVTPDDNISSIDQEPVERQTIVKLKGFKKPYRDSVACSLESMAKKMIEHCFPYFITDKAPQIILKDNHGEKFNLNDYYNRTYRDTIHQDKLELDGKSYKLYHMMLAEGADKHELHLCANNREVKSISLSNFIPDMNKKINCNEKSFYYVGYLAGDYLDEAVNVERSDFVFSDGAFFSDTKEIEIIECAVKFIRNYLNEDLSKIAEDKRAHIDMFVKSKRPQYRLLLNRDPNIYNRIPAGLTDSKLDIELYKQQQAWELDITTKRQSIEEKVKQNATSDASFSSLFDEYCESISELSRACLAEYVARRKAVIDLFETALEYDCNGKYSRESRIHSIICPMQTTSDDIKLDDMNLWLVDDRLAYHHFLASDKKINMLTPLENDFEKRMDLTIFDAALSYTADPENINSITIVELKRPQRDDSGNDPVLQVLNYVKDIKSGRIKKANGRDFGDMSRVSFYCYVIGDLTQSMRDSAESRGLIETQDKEGYFGFNQSYGAYIEVISYDKLLKDAKQRNRVLFDKLFDPKVSDLIHPEIIETE